MSEREMASLIALLEQQLGLSWSDIVEWLRTQNPEDAIYARLIERGVGGVLVQDVQAAAARIAEGLLVDVETAAARYADDIHAAYVQAGQRTAQWLDDGLTDKLIRFDQTNTRAVQRAVANKYELVQGLAEESRTVVRRVVAEGLEAGTNPRVMARSIRETIGLTDKQAQHVENYRRALTSGDWDDALGRELRDKRTDRTIRRLMRDGGQLTPEQVESMVERYRANYIKYRARAIARTEALRAAHEGNEELFRQAIERGDITPEQLESTWNSRSAGPRAREQHQAMDGQTRAYGEPFIAPDGTRLRYPGDPNAGAKHTVNCGCAVSRRLKPPAELEQAA